MSTIKRKRISKKNKGAWRKTDIKDVEQFLEEQRQEERLGSFAEKADEELFTVDASPKVPKRATLTPKLRRKLNAQKPMRSWEALENRSKVQDPIKKRNIVRQKKNGRNIEEEVRNPTKPRHFKANSDRAKYYKELEERAKQPKDDPKKTAKDVWADEDFRDKLPGIKDEKGWVSRELAVYIANNTGMKVVKVHDGLRHRTTKSKKFEPPHPGMSYNPSLQDHRALIDAVVEKEVKIIKEEKHLNRVTTQMFSKVTPEERDRRRLEEMSAGLEDQEEEVVEANKENTKTNKKKSKKASAAVEEEELTDAAYASVNPPVENKKKSKQARNKALKQKALQERTEKKRALKKQIADINRIKSLKTEVLVEEEELNELKKRRKKAAEKRKYEPKRLSKVKFQAPDVDINMPEDISGNVRNIKPESSLLVDRFKNFQKRNILPASNKAPRQKPVKVKRFVRKSHKEPGISHEMLRSQKKQKEQAASKDLQIF